MKKNKYEDIEMIDLEDKADDILEIYIDHLYHTSKTIGVIANKEIAEYVCDTLIKIDEISVKEIDLIDYNGIDEYLVSVDNDGYITCVPIEDYCQINDTDVLYIDMDGSIKQDIIDYCVYEDKEVILFGQKDDDCDDCYNCCDCKLTTSTPTNTSSEYYSVNGKQVNKKEYEEKMEELDSVFCKHISTVLNDYSDFISEMDNWRKLLNW